MTLRLMSKRAAVVIGAAAILTVGAVGAATAIVGDDDATEKPIPGSVVDRAERAALEETGGGTVTGTEVDDEQSTYEVEVTLEDGSQVDVQLDDDFRVVGTEADDPAADDD